MAIAAISSIRSPRTFDRHIKRLIWGTLLGSLALLISATSAASLDESSLIGGLGAVMIVIAGLAVVRDVSRYVRHEAARRADATRNSTRLGACQAAEAIQDRVANLLSVTVGHVDFLIEDGDLNFDSREHAQRALDSALAATRAVSAFRRSLSCGPGAVSPRDLLELRRSPQRAEVRWQYDRSSRTIRRLDGTCVAAVTPVHKGSSDLQLGLLMANAPVLRETLANAQELIATMLAGPPRPAREAARLQAVLEQINQVIDQVDD